MKATGDDKRIEENISLVSQEKKSTGILKKQNKSLDSPINTKRVSFEVCLIIKF